MTSAVAWRANAALVIMGLFGAVLPALALHALTAIMLLAATPALWLAYAIGWWALFALLRVFASFVWETAQIGRATIIGLAVGGA